MTAQSIFSLPEDVQRRFNDIQQFYTERKYQSCEPLLDGILEDHPNCIEVLSLKGLIYRNIPERRSEALPSIKAALKLDIKSDVAWHALGGYYLVEGHYEQAIKSLTQAVAVTSSPVPMLRDLGRAQLMAQKNYGLIKTQQSMFIKDRNSKLDWMTIPLVIDLCDRPAQAATVLGSWFRLPAELRSRCTPQWLSQIRVYLAELLERAGSPKAALAHTTAAVEIDSDFRCTPQAQEITARCALAVGDWPLAQSSYEYLLSYLPNNMDTMIGLTIADPDFHRILPSPIQMSEDEVIGSEANKRTTIDDSEIPVVPVELYPDVITRRGVRSTANVTRPLVSITHRAEHSKLADCNTGELKTAYNRGDLWRLFWAGELEVGPKRPLTPQDIELYVNFVDRFEKLAGEHEGSNEVLRLFPLAFLPRDAILDEIVSERLTTWARERLLKGSVAIIAQAVTLAFSRKWGYTFILEVLTKAMEAIRADCLEIGTCGAVSETIYHAARSRVLRRVAKLYDEADSELDKALEILPTMIDLHVFRAQDLEEDGDIQGALKLLDYCAKLNSADKQLCSDAAIKFCSSGDVVHGLELLDSFNKKEVTPETADEESSEASKFDAQDQELELALCRGLLEHGHVMDKEIASRLHWAMTRLALNQEEVQDFFKYALRIGNMSTLADYIRYIRRIYVIKLAQKSGALLAKVLFYKVDNFDAVPDISTTTPELQAALVNMPCEIGTKELFKLEELTRDQILKETLTDLLKRFRADADVQTFRMLRLSYQLHTRAEVRKDYVLAYCISQTHNLVDRDVYNGKFVRIFMHHIGVEFPNSNVRKLLRKELQDINVQEYIEKAHALLARSDDIRDRYYLICAYEDCLAAEARLQGVCLPIITEEMLEQVRKWLEEDGPMLREKCRAAYERVQLRLRRRAFLQN